MNPELDPHASKISPDDPRLKPRLRKARELQKGPTLIAGAAVIVALAVSVVWAVEPRAKRARDDDSAIDIKPRLPTEILDSPDVVPPSARVDAGAPVKPEPPAQPRLYEVPAEAPHPHTVQRTPAVDDALKARTADVFVEVRRVPDVPRDDAEPKAANGGGDEEQATVHLQETLQHAKQALSDFAPSQPSHENFMETAADRGDGYLHAPLQQPQSEYELKAGTIIPAVLQTAINSDLPGPVFARVRENVYDSLTHEYVLIPQNATLIAAYDAHVVWGQQRVLLCWQRIIFPNGTEQRLECMPGADLTGAAGLTDEVDEHWWRLAKGAALASLLSAATTAAGGDTQGYYPTVTQQFAHGTASEMGRAGERITRRELMVQPTITIRAGWSMNILVTKTIPTLLPYPVD